MYKIVFIDDNKAIIDGLKYIIDWKALDIEICGKAYDGLEGIKIINKIQPDLLITDIRMPGLDGLEMIESILTKHPSLKIIILSGFDDFSYAQKAIEIGVAAYILKPIKKQLLHDKLLEILSEIKDEEFEFQEKEQLVSKISLLSEIAREKYFIDLLNNRIPISSRKSIDCSVLGLQEWPHFYCLLLIEHDFKKSFNYHNYFKSILTSLHNDINDDTSATAVSILDNQVLFFIYGPALSYIEQYREKLLNNLNLHSKFSYYAGISLTHHDVNELSLTYKEAQEALEEVFTNHGTKFYQELTTKTNNKDIDTKPIIEEIINSIKKMNQEKSYINLDQFFKYLTQQNCRTTQFYTESINLFLALKQLVYTYQISHDLETNSNYLNITYLQHNFRTLSALKSTFKKIIQEIIEAIKSTPLSSSELLVEEIIHYLKEHYVDETRESIANHFHITPTYLSKIFKSVTEMNFVDYLTQLKIEQAKAKLLNSTYQIQEISEQLGYANAHYFTKVFKKNTGMTPSKYRKLKGG